MKSFLVSKTIQVMDQKIEITELSGLERFDYLIWCSEQERPLHPEKGAPDCDVVKYIYNTQQYIHRINCRLAAYGCKDIAEDIDSRFNLITQITSPEVAKKLHDEIAEISGLNPINKSEDNKENDSDKEPIDPKV